MQVLSATTYSFFGLIVLGNSEQAWADCSLSHRLAEISLIWLRMDLTTQENIPQVQFREAKFKKGFDQK